MENSPTLTAEDAAKKQAEFRRNGASMREEMARKVAEAGPPREHGRDSAWSRRNG